MVSASYNQAKEITKSDSVDFTVVSGRPVSNAIYIGGAGVVVAVFSNNSLGAFTVPAGTTLPIAAKRVNSTDTTATKMVALYVI